MAVRKKSEDDISVLILRLKNGVVRGSGQGTSEAMTINDFDQAFKRADSALQSHGIIANTSSSSLRQFRNAQRSPIYQLPLEVLTAILILASGVLNGPREPFDRSSLDKPLIKDVLGLAHVSSGWYKVVEALPILWTHILADLSVPLVRMAIVRSNTLPLTVACWSRPNGRRTEFLEDLSEHSDRWEMASLALTIKDLKRITLHRAPLLKVLSVMPLAGNEQETYDGMAEEKPMANELFQGHMPQLEVLKIPYWLKWDEIDYPKLKRLDIKHYVGDLPSVEELISMLSGCPMLETLSILAPVYDHDSGLDFPDGSGIELAHLESLRIEAFEYLALITFIVRLDLPVVTTIEIALGEAPEDNTTRDAIAFVVMAGIKPVIQRLSEWAGTIFVDLDQEDGVQLAFNNSTARASIKLFNFRWTGVMRSVINMSNAFVGRTKYLGVRGGGGEDLSSTRTELVELVTSLRFLIGVTLDGNPNCAELLDMLLDAGNRDAGLVEEVRLWQDLTHIEIEGCICDEMKDLLLVLEKWKDRRKKKLQKYLPYIAIRPGGCTLCAYSIGALEKLVDEGEQCSEAESDVEAGGQ